MNTSRQSSIIVMLSTFTLNANAHLISQLTLRHIKGPNTPEPSETPLLKEHPKAEQNRKSPSKFHFLKFLITVISILLMKS